MVTANKEKGVIKEKSLMSLLTKKVELKKELIVLKKLHEDTKKQKELVESIAKIDHFLSAFPPKKGKYVLVSCFLFSYEYFPCGIHWYIIITN